MVITKFDIESPSGGLTMRFVYTILGRGHSSPPADIDPLRINRGDCLRWCAPKPQVRWTVYSQPTVDTAGFEPAFWQRPMLLGLW